MSQRPKILIDCDPGHDDAMALLVGAAYADIVGITTVAGNAPLHLTTRNALIMADLLGLEVPVHSGAARPLIAPQIAAEYVHGESGIDGAELPEPSRGATSDRAIDFIIDTARAEEGLWLVPTGPLTNIAMALRAAPDIADRIAGISLMGGGSFGNRSTAAEFNIWCDPEAADIVFSYGGPLLMCGLDVTHQLQATPERIETVRAIPGRLATLIADLLVFFSGTYTSRSEHLLGAPIHDACAVMALTHPDLLQSVRRHVVVETQGVHTRGMTVIDQRWLHEREPANCVVHTGIDADAAFAVIVSAVTRFSR